MDRTQLRGTLLVTLSGTLFGCMGYLGTQLLDLNFSVENMLFWRFFVASLCLLPGLFFLKTTGSINNYPISVLLKIFILGAISYSGSTATFFMASRYVGTGLGMVLFFSFPVFVCLFAWLSGQWRMNTYAVLALLAVIIGLFCLKDRGDSALELTGILLGIVSAVCYAVYVYNSKKETKNLDAQWLTFLVCSGNMLLFFGWSYYSGSFMVPNTWQAWGYIFALAIFASILPIWLLLAGLKCISSVKASILSVFEPVVTLLLGVILLSEVLSPLQMVGVVIVLLGAIIIQFERTDETKEKILKALAYK